MISQLHLQFWPVLGSEFAQTVIFTHANNNKKYTPAQTAPAHKKTTTQRACDVTSWDTSAFKSEQGKDEPSKKI